MKQIVTDLNKLPELEIYNMRKIFAKIESHIIYCHNHESDVGAVSKLLSDALIKFSANKYDKVLDAKFRFIKSSILYLIRVSEYGRKSR